MKTLKAIYFLLAALLAFGLFAGCDNGTTSNNDFSDIPDIFGPVEPPDINPIAPPYANIPTLDNYDAIFMGEGHTNRENFGVYLNLLKYYYSLGVRDFALESGYGSTLLLQYYIESGNEECLELIFRYLRGTAAGSQETYNFYKDIYRWNSTLKQKIKLHSFDVEHQTETAIAAIYFYILRKYPKIEGIPGISTAGTYQELINDFKNNKARYSRINADDMKLLGRIIANIEQGVNYYANRVPNSDNLSSDVMREQYMIGNFREIIRDTTGRKIIAIMGWVHADQKGTDTGGPRVGFTMASRLKNETRIASVVLRQQPDPDRFQYIISINENLQTTPYNSTYNGDWPFPNGSGYSGHMPSITRFVAGILLYDSDNGAPEKTVFKVGDQFYYGFMARDSKGDWKRMVHNVTYGNRKYDWSWDFPNEYIGHQGIGTNSGGYRLEAGTYEMEWYIVDAAGNKSNVITRTITVNP